MGTLSEREILEILKLVEESSFSELRLETAELKLIVRKNGHAGSVAELDSNGPSAPPAQARQATIRDGAAAHGVAAVSAPVPVVSAVPTAKVAASSEGTVPIKSPMLGTAYRRPSPDAPPYVEIGSFVSENDTVCLIEVMKVFTAVKAGMRGYVTDILFENNSMIEYGQTLFLVCPETASH